MFMPAYAAAIYLIFCMRYEFFSALGTCSWFIFHSLFLIGIEQWKVIFSSPFLIAGRTSVFWIIGRKHLVASVPGQSRAFPWLGSVRVFSKPFCISLFQIDMLYWLILLLPFLSHLGFIFILALLTAVYLPPVCRHEFLFALRTGTLCQDSVRIFIVMVYSGAFLGTAFLSERDRSEQLSAYDACLIFVCHI